MVTQPLIFFFIYILWNYLVLVEVYKNYAHKKYDQKIIFT